MADSSMTLVAGGGSIFVADVGTTAPTDVTAAWPDGWSELGFISDEGVKITYSKDRTDKRAWNTLAIIRVLYTAVTLDLGFSALEWNADTVPLAFGGGAWVTAGTVSKYDIASNPSANEKALGLEFTDPASDHAFRLIVPRVALTADGDITLTNTDTAPLPVTAAALAASTGVPLASLLSNAAGLVA